MGIPLVCDRWLTLPSNPDLVIIDDLYEAAAAVKRLDLALLTGEAGSRKAAALPDKGIVLKRTKSVDYSETPSENGSQADRVSLDKRSQNSEEMQTAFREEVWEFNCTAIKYSLNFYFIAISEIDFRGYC